MIGVQVRAVDEWVTQLDTAHSLYMDQAMAAARISLQAEINGKAVMIKASCQQ